MRTVSCRAIDRFRQYWRPELGIPAALKMLMTMAASALYVAQDPETTDAIWQARMPDRDQTVLLVVDEDNEVRTVLPPRISP